MELLTRTVPVDYKKIKIKKMVFLLHSLLVCTAQTTQTRVSSLVLAVVFLYSRLGEETTKSTSFPGRSERPYDSV